MFDLFYQHVDCLCQCTDTEEPSLPRKRKTSRWFEVDEGEDYHSPTVGKYYHNLCYEVLDSGSFMYTRVF